MPVNMKNMIADAFLAMTARKSVDKITVKDLVEACDISRQTFYYHFQDILEVIECSEKLMSGGEKRWFQIRHDIAQAKRFSVLLETVHLRHLVSQVSA